MRRVACVVALVLAVGCTGQQNTAQSPAPSSSPSPSTALSPSPSPSPPPSPTSATVAAGSFKLTAIASGLASPVYVTSAGDGSGRLFIVEQAGRILVMKDGRVLPTPFLDIRSLVVAGGERGLLSVAFHPDFESNGVFVVNYTRSGGHVGDTVIARYRVSPASADVADRSSGQALLTIYQPQSNHNGGLVMFGPDGFLYIGMGDGGAGGDLGAAHAPQGNGQSLTTLLGKLLRIAVFSTGSYAAPATNPNIRTGALREIWSYGLRNPWRFSFDRLTSDLYIGDVGQNAWEEVDFRPASSKGGENYGWPRFEGNHIYRSGVSVSGDVKPVAEYPHAGECSVTGGYVYRGQRVPSMYGFYVFGDYCSGKIRTLINFRGRWTMSTLVDTSLLISSFGEDEAGELYVVNLGGSVYRFDSA
jgi:glucose/arabinose dehydrogenase